MRHLKVRRGSGRRLGVFLMDEPGGRPPRGGVSRSVRPIAGSAGRADDEKVQSRFGFLRYYLETRVCTRFFTSFPPRTLRCPSSRVCTPMRGGSKISEKSPTPEASQNPVEFSLRASRAGRFRSAYWSSNKRFFFHVRRLFPARKRSLCFAASTRKGRSDRTHAFFFG